MNQTFQYAHHPAWTLTEDSILIQDQKLRLGGCQLSSVGVYKNFLGVWLDYEGQRYVLYAPKSRESRKAVRYIESHASKALNFTRDTSKIPRNLTICICCFVVILIALIIIFR